VGSRPIQVKEEKNLDDLVKTSDQPNLPKPDPIKT
jgi:hypothetical protein